LDHQARPDRLRSVETLEQANVVPIAVEEQRGCEARWSAAGDGDFQALH
jgi:hypothetical protein